MGVTRTGGEFQELCSARLSRTPDLGATRLRAGRLRAQGGEAAPAGVWWTASPHRKARGHPSFG
eukprot:2290508-Alexandrium_andersonii.AAC.1